MTRGNLAALGWVRAGVVAIVAGALALLVGVALSPVTPIGTARFAEPRPGVWAPSMILLVGASTVVLAIVGLALVPSWRAAVGTERPAAPAVRPSVAARLLSAVTSKPSPTIGARFALEPGRGATAVPVRSSLTAAVAAIVAILTALTVAASVRHLAVTPRLYGQTWDATIDDQNRTISFDPGSKDLDDLTSNPSISDAVVGIFQGAIYRINGVAMDGVAFDAAKGDLEPVILEGRSPKGADEVLVGRKSLEETKARIGSTVTVGIVSLQKTVPMRVVGITVLPFDDDTSTIGEGLWVTRAGLRQIIGYVPSSSALVRFASGVSRATAVAKLGKRFPGAVSTSDVPNGVRNYRRLSQLPLVLAGLLAALAAGTLAHMLISSIRRRRRDLAILKTLGFARGQIRDAVTWQAAIFTLVAVAIAAPLSIVVGRWTWNVIARYGGFAAATILPPLQFAIVAAGAVAVGLIVAVWPARAAARTPAAVVLRTE
jgi:ABC-type lipoprotein release transport system permease subunit